MGDGGNSVGLFHWNGPRNAAFRQALGDNWTDWREQIKYALREPGEPGPTWKSMTFSSAQEAADWWMRNWERPGHPGRDSARHRDILQGLGFQTGGMVSKKKPKISSRTPDPQGGSNIVPTPSIHSREFQNMLRSSRHMGLHDLQTSNKPIIVPVPMGGGGVNKSGTSTGTSSVPSLPASPRSHVSADYVSRVNFGITLS